MNNTTTELYTPQVVIKVQAEPEPPINGPVVIGGRYYQTLEADSGLVELVRNRNQVPWDMIGTSDDLPPAFRQRPACYKCLEPIRLDQEAVFIAEQYPDGSTAARGYHLEPCHKPNEH